MARYWQAHLNNVEGVEGVHPTQTIPTKELNGETIKTTIRAVLLAEFALAVGSKIPPAFKPDEFVEEHVTFGCPQ